VPFGIVVFLRRGRLCVGRGGLGRDIIWTEGFRMFVIIDGILERIVAVYKKRGDNSLRTRLSKLGFMGVIFLKME